MKISRLTIYGMLTLIFLVSGCQQTSKNKNKFSSFKAVDDSVYTLYQKKQYQEAINLLEINKAQFTDNLYDSEWFLFVLHKDNNQYEEALNVISKANDKGFWYGISESTPFYSELQKQDNFNSVITKNNRLKQIAQEKAKPHTVVELPKNYSADKKYPLFIAIHGYGENVAFFKDFWKSEKIKNEFIIMYPQSSQVANMSGFGWTDKETGIKEISLSYSDVISRYPINKDQIIVGGFSQGGGLSIQISLQNIIPVRGFVSLCPIKPDGITITNIVEMNNRNMHGVILTGENDSYLTIQKEIVSKFDSLKFPCNFIVHENLGHWFPNDIGKKIDDAIIYIL